MSRGSRIRSTGATPVAPATHPCQAKTAARAGSRRVGLVEALEDVRQVPGRDTRTRVGHLDIAPGTVGAGPHPDIAAAVLDRVAEEVGQDPLDPARVRGQRDRLALHRDPVLPAPRAEQRGDHGPDVDQPPLDRLGPGIEPGDLQQLLDQRPEPAHIADQQLNRAAGRDRQVAGLAGEQRGPGDQRGQRRAQLVCHVRGEPHFAGLRRRQRGDLRLKRIGHLVERGGPRAELVRRAGLDALTSREIDVLRHVARGLSNAETARALHISPAPPKPVSRQLAKLGAPDRAQLAVIAYESGLIPHTPAPR